jgi:hypothetical protein
MTLILVDYTPSQILFASDTYRYHLREGWQPENFEKFIEKIDKNHPKIYPISKNTVIACGGSEDYSFFAIYIASLVKDKCTLKTVNIENGKVKFSTAKENAIYFASFSPKITDIFKAKHLFPVTVAPALEDKTHAIKLFFEEASETFKGLVDPKPILAKLDHEGFTWI